MKLQVSVMVCVVLEKSGGCLAQVEYSSHQLIKKEEGRFVPCVCVGFERWREDQLEQPQHTAGESGSGVDSGVLHTPSKVDFTSSDIKAGSRPGPATGHT